MILIRGSDSNSLSDELGSRASLVEGNGGTGLKCLRARRIGALLFFFSFVLDAQTVHSSESGLSRETLWFIQEFSFGLRPKLSPDMTYYHLILFPLFLLICIRFTYIS